MTGESDDVTMGHEFHERAGSEQAVDHPVSWDRPVWRHQVSFCGCIMDRGAQSPIDAAEERERREIIEFVLKSLTYRERETIKLRYGLGDGYTYTLEEVGRIFKISPKKAGQVEAAAIRNLQHPVRSRRLEFCLSRQDKPSRVGSTRRFWLVRDG